MTQTTILQFPFSKESKFRFMKIKMEREEIYIKRDIPDYRSSNGLLYNKGVHCGEQT